MAALIVSDMDLHLAARLCAIAQEHAIDAAIGTDLRTARYLMALRSCKVTILDEPDVSPFMYDPSAHQWGAKRRRPRCANGNTVAF